MPSYRETSELTGNVGLYIWINSGSSDNATDHYSTLKFNTESATTFDPLCLTL